MMAKSQIFVSNSPSDDNLKNSRDEAKGIFFKCPFVLTLFKKDVEILETLCEEPLVRGRGGRADQPRQGRKAATVVSLSLPRFPGIPQGVAPVAHKM